MSTTPPSPPTVPPPAAEPPTTTFASADVTPRVARGRRSVAFTGALLVMLSVGGYVSAQRLWATPGQAATVVPVAAAPAEASPLPTTTSLLPPTLEDATVRASAGAATVAFGDGDYAAMTRIVVAPQHGAAVYSDGAISYEADPTFAGTDSLTYESCSGYDACATANVTFEVVPDGASRLVLKPKTLVDTRPDSGGDGPVAPGDIIKLGVAPPEATAVVLKVAVMAPQQTGDLVVNAGDTPTARLAVDGNLSMATGLLYAAVVGGEPVDLEIGSGGMVIADRVGWYITSTTADSGRFVSVATQRIARLVTKRDGREATVDVAGHPAILRDEAGAVLLRVTADVGADGGTVGLGYGGGVAFRLMWPSSEGSATRTRQGIAIVPLSAAGTFDFEYNGGTDITIDALGYFTNDNAAKSVSGLFVPIWGSPEATAEVDAESTEALPVPIGFPQNAGAALVEFGAASGERSAEVALFAADDSLPKSPTLRLTPGEAKSVLSVVDVGAESDTLFVFSSEPATWNARFVGYFLR